MSTFSQSILKMYDSCVCFSPHLDDAVFSTGGLLSELVQHMPVTVVNVMTTAGSTPRTTLSARAFLKQSGASTPQSLYAVREREDQRALEELGAKRIDLGYTDALWRLRPTTNEFVSMLGSIVAEAVVMYPTYRRHITSGIVHAQDKNIIRELSKKFSDIVTSPRTLVLAPCGVGGHVDHCVVRDAAHRAFGDRVYYYIDFPYFARSGNTNTFVSQHKLTQHTHDPDVNRKTQLCSLYTSQYDIVFGDKSVIAAHEQYFHTS